MHIAVFTPSTYYPSWRKPDSPVVAADSTAERPAQPADQSNSGTQSQPAAVQRDEKSEALRQAEQLELTRMISRDQEVRLHEQAHAAIGGRHAGAPSYTYERGPDGKRYAVAGEVGIDVGAVPNDPEATMRKMEQVIRAALAPAEPSAQDRQIAAQAQLTLTEARLELAQVQRQAALEARESRSESVEESTGDQLAAETQPATQQTNVAGRALELYRQTTPSQDQKSLIDLSI